jgi:hypothetical protein
VPKANTSPCIAPSQRLHYQSKWPWEGDNMSEDQSLGQSKRGTTITPTHLAIAVAVVVAAIAALPWLQDVYRDAYPPLYSARREAIETCIAEGNSRFFLETKSMRSCLAYEAIKRR